MSTLYSKRGFTIFFAVLVASLALAVGLAIYDLLIRELALSQVAVQSQYAIYAADTGAECALYWDQKYVNVGNNNHGGSNSAFATSSPLTDKLVPASGITCTVQYNGAQQDVAANGTPPTPFAIPPTNWSPWDTSQQGATFATTTFYIVLGTTATSSCARVEVGKRSKNGNPSITTVDSHGFNTCSDGVPLRLERVLKVTY